MGYWVRGHFYYIKISHTWESGSIQLGHFNSRTMKSPAYFYPNWFKFLAIATPWCIKLQNQNNKRVSTRTLSNQTKKKMQKHKNTIAGTCWEENKISLHSLNHSYKDNCPNTCTRTGELEDWPSFYENDFFLFWQNRKHHLKRRGRSTSKSVALPF